MGRKQGLQNFSDGGFRLICGNLSHKSHKGITVSNGHKKNRAGIAPSNYHSQSKQDLEYPKTQVENKTCSTGVDEKDIIGKVCQS